MKRLILILLLIPTVKYSFTAQRHIDTAKSYWHVKEVHNNRGSQIDIFNATVGNPLGASWCAAYVGYCLKASKVNVPKLSGLARNYYVRGYKTYSSGSVIRGINTPQRGDIVIWARGNTVYGHCGYVLAYNKKTGVITTIEGNTSPTNQSDGDGVYIKYRKIEPYDFFRIIGFSKVLY